MAAEHAEALTNGKEALAALQQFQATTSSLAAKPKNVKMPSQRKKKSADVKDEPADDIAVTKLDLFEDEANSLTLWVVLKKMPLDQKIVHVNMPHSFRHPKTTSVCLFVKDLSKEKHDPDVDKDAREFRDYLTYEKGVDGLDEIISLRQLKREYSTYEAKRKLSSAFDVFLCDDRVLAQVMRNLGRSFYEKKKLPKKINITKGDVKLRIQNRLSYVPMVIKKVTLKTHIKFGLTSQPVADLVDNLRAVLVELSKKLPGSWENVSALYVSTEKSPKLPIYASYMLEQPKSKFREPVEDELSTLDAVGAKVRVTADGYVNVLDKDGNRLFIDSDNEDSKLQPKRKKMRFQTADKFRNRRHGQTTDFLPLKDVTLPYDRIGSMKRKKPKVEED